MSIVLEEDIDDFGLDEFSEEFLTELDRAEEAFPSSFCAAPPMSVISQDEYDMMFLEPCSQEMTQALDEMEHHDFVPTHSASQPVPRHCSSPSPPHGQMRPPVSSAPASAGCFKNVTTAGRICSSESTTCTTLVPSTTPSVCVKAEPASPAISSSPVKLNCKRRRSISESDSDSDADEEEEVSSSPTPSPVKLHWKRRRSVSENNSDNDDDDSEVAFKKPKLSSPPPTHLSQFFASYPKYEYDPSGPVSQQFQELRRVYKFDKRAGNYAYEAYNRALGMTFSQEFGDDVNSLENWQRLCDCVKIDPIPDTLEECQLAIEDSHVNLIDLVDLRTTGQPVHRFGTERQLSVYTLKTGKIFPRSLAYKGDLLRHLLRNIYNPPADNLIRRRGYWVERGS